MLNFQLPQSPTVLLVPDSLFWITGTISKAIATHAKGINAIVCSEAVLNELLALHDGRFPVPLDVVHFQTPHVATRQYKNFESVAACVATIHHVDSDASTEPAPYVDAVTTGCVYWRDYHSRYVCDPAKLVMVRYGLDVKLFRPAANSMQRTRLRRRYGIEEKSFVIGFSAKRTSDVKNRKGINVLEALITMSTERQDHFTWIVRGPGWQELVNKLRNSGTNIIYLPFLPMERDVAESYLAMDTFVVTARIEGGPYPLIEAMSSGVPVVSTAVGIGLEVVKNGETGFVVPFDDPEAIYSRLLQIRSDRLLQAKLARNGRQIVCDTLKWEESVKAIPELYEVAMKNFATRTGNGRATAMPDPANMPYHKKLRRWINSRELAEFSQFLSEEQCHDAARHFANRAILSSPFDRTIFKRCAKLSSFSILYKASIKMIVVLRSCRKIAKRIFYRCFSLLM